MLHRLLLHGLPLLLHGLQLLLQRLLLHWLLLCMGCPRLHGQQLLSIGHHAKWRWCWCCCCVRGLQRQHPWGRGTSRACIGCCR